MRYLYILKRSFILVSLLVCSASVLHAQSKKPAAKKSTAAKPATTKPAAAATTTTTTTTPSVMAAPTVVPASSSTPLAGSTPAMLTEKFFKLYEKDGSAKAINFIFKTNKQIDSTRLFGLITKVDSVRAAYGLYTGKELIMQRKVSNSLVLYAYLVKHQYDFVRFTFIFYKPKNDWEIYRLYFDGNVTNELQDAAKATGKP